MNISENNTVEGQMYIGGEEYLISGTELRPNIADLSKQKNYDKIKAISDRINLAKRNNEGKFNLSFVVKLNNIIGEKIIFCNQKKNIKIYKYKHKKKL